MKKISIVLLTTLVAFQSFAQDAQTAAAQAAKAISAAPKTEKAVEKKSNWALKSDFLIGFNQTSLTNWSAGGYNTISFVSGIDAAANYAKDFMSWNNRLQLDYGFFWSADKQNVLQKSKDRIYLQSKWAYKTGTNSKWSYSAGLDFKTQFSNNFTDYVKETDGDNWIGKLKSGFLSPANVDLALGLDWDPAPWLDLSISPLTGGVVIVTEDALRSNYGMKQDEDGSYLPALFQLGARVKVDGKWVINNKLSLETQLVVFTDYLNKPFVYNRINWDNKIGWQVTKFFKLGLDTWLIYDPIVKIDGVASKVQFKEFFAVNFTYSISNAKKK